ncbi:cytochrome c-like domain-containing protein [Tuber borchii]|uniref:Cytochrome c-like domain-containing protein n=1 Tax=Tuber borchii TaxID=42251 RepID=A0A2T7A247_TUBBO|nr:cytochrome c-like domain-containing protein [Tuber borchii]
MGFEEGDSKKGADLFKQHCSGCHTLEAGGANKAGPNLHGVFGRQSKKEGVVWTEEALFEYLESPQKYIPGTKKTVRMKSRTERRDLITHLRKATK